MRHVSTASSFKAAQAYQERRSVMYRAGHQAGLFGIKPNRYSMDVEFYANGYYWGTVKRTCIQLALVAAGGAAFIGFVATLQAIGG